MSGRIKSHRGDRTRVSLHTMKPCVIVCVERPDKERGLDSMLVSPASDIDKTLWAA